MLRLIVGFAKDDDRIRAVLMTGSRADPGAERDPFQDYDITHLVEDVEPFRNRAYVLSHFGEALIVEEPLLGPWPPAGADGSYHNYNVQLVDGNRVDLVFRPIDRLAEALDGGPAAVLLDKDGRFPSRPTTHAPSHVPTPPTEALYRGCCAGFLFTLGSHIPKTIWRRKLPLLKFYIETCLRDALVMMLEWEVGTRTGWAVSVGKKGRDLQLFLAPKAWEDYRRTHAGYDYADLWDSLFLFHDLFRRSAEIVAEAMGFEFPHAKSEQVLEFLRHVRELPGDARTIY